MRKPFVLIASALLVVAASQCVQPPPAAEPTNPEDLIYWKPGPHGSGPARIVISLGEQRVALFHGSELVGMSPISSGREGHDTRPGQFAVIQKDRDHTSSCYGSFVDKDNYIVVEDVDVRRDKPPAGTHFMGAPMAWFIRFNGGIGMHQGNLPGFPASHGCIRLPGNMAYRLFEACKVGTPVEVQRHANLLALMPTPATQDPASATRTKPKLMAGLFAPKKSGGNSPAALAAPPPKPEPQPEPKIEPKPEPKREVAASKPSAPSAEKKTGFFGGLFARKTESASERAESAARPLATSIKPKAEPKPEPQPEPKVEPKPEPKREVAASKPSAPSAEKSTGFFGGLFARRAVSSAAPQGASRNPSPARAQTQAPKALPPRLPALAANLRPITPEVPGIPSAPRSYQPAISSDQAPAAPSARGYLRGKLSDREGVVISPHAPFAEVDVTGLEPGSLAVDPNSNQVFEVPGGHLRAKPTKTPGLVISPYKPYRKVDVGGMASGSLAIDPTTQRVFEVP